MKEHDPQTVGPNVYRHYKGGLYRVLDDNVMCSTNGLDDGKRMVLYVSMTNGRVFTRTHEQFFELITDGTLTKEAQPRLFRRFAWVPKGVKL